MAKKKVDASLPKFLNPAAVEAALDSLVTTLPDGPLSATAISNNHRRKLWDRIQVVIERLSAVNVELDLIALPPLLYNPADPDTFAESIGNKLLIQEATPVAEILKRKFYGSGVYALFYRGDFDAYQPIRGTRTPIYVGKAIPMSPQKKGKRTAIDSAGVPKTARQQGPAVWSRIKEHAGSISEAENLNLDDFDCRYLVTATGWQVAAEAHLISLFKPVWNKEMQVLMGLGKHGDWHETRGNSRSLWDTLHPGRKWATREGNVPNEKSIGQIKADVAEHFRKFPPKG